MLETLTEPTPLSMEQRVGLGNQQESSRPVSLIHRPSYLAGLFDGEGYIGITVNKRKNASPQYYPRASIVNTNPVIIEKASEILTINGIAHHTMKWDTCRDEHKVRYTIDMTGFRRAFRFAYFMEPYLIAKKVQAQLVLAFLWSRLKHGNSYNHVPYSEDEVRMYLACKELNAKGREIPREHTSRAVEFAAKMCSDLRSKGAEATETMARLDRGKGWSRS